MSQVDLTQQFVFAPWWDTSVKVVKNTVPVIHQKVQELRREVGGLEAQKQQFGPRFPVKSAKELELKLQPALDKCGLTMTCAYEIHNISPSEIPVIKNKSGDDQVVRTACWVVCTIRLCAEDGSWVESQGAGGGMDGDDKAIGKATTYSRKDAVMKMLAVPDKNMIDTDDEEATGAPTAKGSKRKAATRDYAADIAAAPTLEALKALLPALVAQPPDDKVRLGVAYKAREAALS